MLMTLSICGCSKKTISDVKVKDLEYTVVEDEDLPKELYQMINEKKKEDIQMTYQTNEYMYVVYGYGTKMTNGYSISVDDFYLSKNAIYLKTTLYGPKNTDTVSKCNTYPYIVLKTERRAEPVIYE